MRWDPGSGQVGPGIGWAGGPGRLEPTGDDLWSGRADETIYKPRMSSTAFGALGLLEHNRKRIPVVCCELLFCTRHDTPRYTSPSRCLPTILWHRHATQLSGPDADAAAAAGATAHAHCFPQHARY